MRIYKDPQWLVLCDVTWIQRPNKQMCCLAYNYRLKTYKNLKFIGLVCLSMFLPCTNYKRSMSRDSGSKMKKPINVANMAQPRAFEPLMLET